MHPTSDAEFAHRPVSRLRIDQFLNHWRVGQLLLSVLDRVMVKKPEDFIVHRVSVDEYKDNLKSIVKLAEKHDIAIVLLTRPYIGRSWSTWWWKTYAHEYRAATVELAEQYDIPIIDVYGHFKDQTEYFHDESHFNEPGHRRLASMMLEEVLPLLDARQDRD